MKVCEIKSKNIEEVYDYKNYGLKKPLNKGERFIVSQSKNGYKASGFLEYYKNEVLVKTKNIRNDSYNPTKEIVLVG